MIDIQQILPDMYVVKLEGRFTMETAPEIRREIMKAARKRSIRGIDVDLSGVSSLDTAGVAVLIELLGILTRRRAGLRLIGPGESALRMIHLARLDQTFELAESVGE